LEGRRVVRAVDAFFLSTPAVRDAGRLAVDFCDWLRRAAGLIGRAFAAAAASIGRGSDFGVSVALDVDLPSDSAACRSRVPTGLQPVTSADAVEDDSASNKQKVLIASNLRASND
jgi:hypothetical protein